jgi:hypothetical protein
MNTMRPWQVAIRDYLEGSFIDLRATANGHVEAGNGHVEAASIGAAANGSHT